MKVQCKNCGNEMQDAYGSVDEEGNNIHYVVYCTLCNLYCTIIENREFVSGLKFRSPNEQEIYDRSGIV